MIERSRRVVLLIDYDNLQICASRDTPGRDLQLTPVVQLAQHYGTVILARAYAEWNLSTERLAVYKAGIEPAFAPVLRTESDRSGKSLADTVMVAEGMDMLWTLSPEVVVLATSDKDLIPLVRVAKQRGAFVVVLGSDFTAIPLREMADEHVTYKQLITDSQGRYVTEAGPARQPAALTETTRRRPTRERNGRERALVTAPTTPTPAAAAPPPARIEREQPALPTPTPTPSPAVASATEPVAPLTVGAAGDGDAQALGRRRRRRGSRRRSERIGGPGEGLSTSDGGPDGDELDADEAYAEQLEAEEPEELIAAAADATPAEVAELVRPGSTTLEAAASVPLTADPEFAEAAPPPRNRRRSTRRPTAEAAAATAPPASEPDVAPPAADILWAEPAPADGLAAPADAEPSPPDGEPIAEAEAEPAAATPRPRSRRVASAARGRTRPASSR